MRDKTSPSSFKHQLEQNSPLLLNDDLADDFADENGHGKDGMRRCVGGVGKNLW